MADNLQNTSTIKTNNFSKGMLKDVADMYMSEGSWYNAINAVNNSHKGEVGVIGNEPSNRYCASAPYTIIGAVHQINGRWVIFSTNNTDSEIGIFDEIGCQYTQVVNDPCLNFKTTHLITGAIKYNYDCTYSVYFQDNRNPDRVLNLSNVPYIPTGVNLSPDPDCWIPEYSTDLDCDKLRLHPLIQQPCVHIQKAKGNGQLTNGSYQVVIAYSSEGIKLTDYSIPSASQPLWEHEGIGGGLEITIDNLDPNFEEYEVVVIITSNQQTIAKKIGNYSIRQTKITLDQILGSLPTVDLAQIPLRSVIYEKSEKMHVVNNYLLRSGVTSKEYINYQSLANQIKVEWAAVEYDYRYYQNGGNITGYMRDEVYALFIRWVYANGTRTASYHIPGRAQKATDIIPTATSDTLTGETLRWQVYDTATINATGALGTTKDGGIITAIGDCAYHESTEKYPDDEPLVWGSLCGKPIRHHKMPSNETTHIHSNGSDKINILGLRFDNIKVPVDENGNAISDIVGYEILRGSREGNRSIVAKGMFNNMWSYTPLGTPSKDVLYQNYPYNDLRDDFYLTTNRSLFETGGTGNHDDDPQTNFKQDYYSFHSPETTFNKPYLGGNYVKIYTEEIGEVNARFELPYKHPKHKLITDAVLISAALVGTGIALVALYGKTTTSIEQVLPSGTITTISRESGIGSISGDLTPTLFNVNGLPGVASSVVMLLANGMYFLGQGIDQVLDIFYKLIKYRHYELQYNSHGYYNNFTGVSNTSVPAGVPKCYRREIPDSGIKYIGSMLQDFDTTFKVNNLNRNKYVGLKVNSNIPVPTTQDISRERVRDVNSRMGDTKFFLEPYNKQFTSRTVAYYGAIKVDYQNQYGQLDSIVEVPTDSCVIETEPDTSKFYQSDIIFGGDIYINRYTEKNPFYFFNSWLKEGSDGFEFNYKNYINGPIPRYWVDFDKFDVTDFDITSSGLITPSDFHRLDRPGFGTGVFAIRKAWFYLFCNGIRDFYVESEYNLAFRDYGEETHQKFYDPYGNALNDYNELFRSDIIDKPIYYKYDLSLSVSKMFNNFATWGNILPRDYNPAVYSTCFEYQPFKTVYSLQHHEGLKRDNWRNFLPLNEVDLPGRVTSIKKLNANGSLILFENAEPVQFVGIDQLQTKNGVKVTIGDGGLFKDNMQSITNADDALYYGSSHSSRSVLNTPYGVFYASQKTGKIMQYSSGLNESSRDGMKHWFVENLPFKLLQTYPNYPHYDNPVAGIGITGIYDPQYEMLYFSKKDYIAKRTDLHFDAEDGIPYYYCGTSEYEWNPSDDPLLNQVIEDSDIIGNCEGPMDVAFVLDITGSMDSTLANLKTSIGGIISEISVKSGNDYRLGLITVNENHTTGSLNQRVTYFDNNNSSTFTTNLNAVNIGVAPNGGGLGPEPWDLAVEDVVNDGLGAWRTNATKLVFVISDNYPSGGDDAYSGGGGDEEDRIISTSVTAVSKGIVIYPIGVRLPASPTTPPASLLYGYAYRTGGEYTNSVDGSISNNILGTIETLQCPVSCSISLSKTDITLGELVILTFRSKYAINVQLSPAPVGYANNYLNGHVLLQPTASGTYSITVTDQYGNTRVCSVELTVTEGSVIKKCKCEYDNPECFDPCNWTISYDPKNKIWVSFHDWHPSLMIPSEKHFFTIKDNELWKHNDRWDSFCNFYGTDYPWEVEYPINTPNNITTLRNVEYELEVMKYFNEGKDHFHVLDQNFDQAVIFNSEQISGLLNMNIKGKNSPLDMINYPIINPNSIDIIFSKEENKYRFNQFWDVTNDRGEFSGDKINMWNTDCDGYTKTMNPANLNYSKSPFERKKFRHYGNRIILRKSVSGENKMILLLTNAKLLNSSR